MKRGFLATVEGIEGVGKTVIAKELTRRLHEAGLKAVYTYEPSDGPYGKRVRELIKRGGHIWRWEIGLLLALDRAWHVKTIILPKLKEGLIVICDRYIHSQLAYQTAEGLDPYVLEILNMEFPKPDLVIFLDSDPAVAMMRLKLYSERHPDVDKKSIFNDEDFLRKVRSSYSRYIRDPRFTRELALINIDSEIGTEGLLPEDEYARKVRDIALRLAELIIRRL
ncbi:MAG: dTMP kinase [Thermoprotei archaeon]|nr:dTMP kinase [Thermoprotei archaeon]